MIYWIRFAKENGAGGITKKIKRKLRKEQGLGVKRIQKKFECMVKNMIKVLKVGNEPAKHIKIIITTTQKKQQNIIKNIEIVGD